MKDSLLVTFTYDIIDHSFGDEDKSALTICRCKNDKLRSINSFAGKEAREVYNKLVSTSFNHIDDDLERKN